jgi:protein-S-isoprenylcysteine O-methyltransferase Ste14
VTEDPHQTSRKYAVVQTVLLCAFAGTFFLMDGPWLLPPERFRAVGAVLCAAGVLLMVGAFLSIRGAIQIAPEPRRGAQLVTRGVYRHLRHPIYTAILILVVGLFLRKPSVAIAIAATAVTAFLLAKVRLEEKLLLARYPEYAEYKSRTWGIVPWFRGSSRKAVGR